MALASILDYETITGKACPDVARVSGLLSMASSAVLAGAHDQQIVHGPFSAVCRPWEGIVYLPQRPVTSITSVTVAGELLDSSAWRVEPGGNRRPARLYRRTSTGDGWWTGEVEIDGTAGWDPVPGQIVAAVVAMAAGVAASDGSAGVIQESAGPLQVSLAPGQVQAPDMSLTASTRRMLDELCGVDGPGSVPTPRDQP